MNFLAIWCVGLVHLANFYRLLNWAGPIINPTGTWNLTGSGLNFHPIQFCCGLDFCSNRPIAILRRGEGDPTETNFISESDGGVAWVVVESRRCGRQINAGCGDGAVELGWRVWPWRAMVRHVMPSLRPIFHVSTLVVLVPGISHAHVRSSTAFYWLNISRWKVTNWFWNQLVLKLPKKTYLILKCLIYRAYIPQIEI
jgi:hypothetical protein